MRRALLCPRLTRRLAQWCPSLKVVPLTRATSHWEETGQLCVAGSFNTTPPPSHYKCIHTRGLEGIRVSYTELHFLNMMLQYDASTGPLNAHIARYMSRHSKIGSNQRRLIQHIAWDMQRWLILVDHVVETFSHEAGDSQFEELLERGLDTGTGRGGVWDAVTDQRLRDKALMWRARYYVLCELMLKDRRVVGWLMGGASDKHDPATFHLFDKIKNGYPASIFDKTIHDRVWQAIHNAPVHVRASLPAELFHTIQDSLGCEELAVEFCRASNMQAPVYIRMNPLRVQSHDRFIAEFKGSLGRMLQKSGRRRAEDEFKIAKTDHSEHGFIVKTPPRMRIDFTRMDLFQQGWFEVQDEASQLVSDLVKARSDDIVLDYCAGSGGKTLAFAHRVQGGKGHVYLTDIRYSIDNSTGCSSALFAEAKRRLERSGIKNATVLPMSQISGLNLEGRVDWLLLDVPCSGSGTLRRQPHLKYELRQWQIEAYISKQREIIRNTIKFLNLGKASSRLVYATCSILRPENLGQVDYILERYGNVLELEMTFSTITGRDAPDGFFAAVFRPRQSDEV